jgi:hypothetical protein
MARLNRLRKRSALYSILGGAALQCVRENSSSRHRVEQSTAEHSPGGAFENARRFSAGKSRKTPASPGGTTEVLTHTLQRCDNCTVLNAALAAEVALAARELVSPQPAKSCPSLFAVNVLRARLGFLLSWAGGAHDLPDIKITRVAPSFAHSAKGRTPLSFRAPRRFFHHIFLVPASQTLTPKSCEDFPIVHRGVVCSSPETALGAVICPLPSF